MRDKKTKRAPVVSGLFYPDKAEELNSIVEKYLSEVDRKSLFESIGEQINVNPEKTSPIAIITPHAGFMFSGRIQAHSYALVAENNYDTVVIIGGAHQKEFSGISVNKDYEYEIPTGTVEVDLDFVNELLTNEGISTVEEAHLQEHSIEVQLPFIKKVFPNSKIVPVLFGDQYLTTAENLYRAIVKAVKKLPKEYLFVISSDLSHYHNYVDAKNLDETLISILLSMNEKELYQCVKSRKCEACCYAGIITGIMLSKDFGIGKSAILKYVDSGAASGDRRRVVGYLSAALF